MQLIPGWLTRLWTTRADQSAVAAEVDSSPWTLRRYEGASTDRLNKAHWGSVTGQPINADLLSDLATLRHRAAFEAANNPFVEGVIDTHATDIVGECGPSLQVHSSSDRYNTKLEKLWKNWWGMPDINGQLSGADMARLWVRMLWICGEFLVQKVTDATAFGSPVSLRLLNLHPERLDTPPNLASDAMVGMGVRRTREGKPTQYYITDPLPFGAMSIAMGNYTPVSPDDIIHQFRMLESGQIRGVPWLASSLQTVADIRDYDAQVLDAARMAADQATFLYTDHPDAPFVQANESTTVQRRTISTMPPGWKPQQLNPTQPSTNYIQYRMERLRELGRPVNMPLMTVRLGSEDHNYSSARFDGQVYLRGLRVLQAWIERGALNNCLRDIAREATLAGALPQAPVDGDVTYEWTWPIPPHVDPSKEADAWLALVEMGAADLRDVCAANGWDYDEVQNKRERTAKDLKARDLPPAPFWQPKPPQMEGGNTPQNTQKTPENGQKQGKKAVASA